MRYIKYCFLILLGVILCFMALANRDPVTLRLLPDSLASIIPTPAVVVPTFIVVLGGIIFGLFIGFFWEWLREHQHRSKVTKKDRQIRDLEREVSGLKKNETSEDEILALLEK